MMRRLIWFSVAILLLTGCGVRTVYVPNGTPVRLRETIKDAKVWVKDADGESVAGRMDIPEGWYALERPVDRFSMIVEQTVTGTQPAVPPAVAYPDMRLEQPGGVKLRGQCSPQGRLAKAARHCQHQGGREPGLSGMVNGSELSINVVNHNEPKVLTGSDQKVWEQAGELSAFRLVDVASSAKRQDLTRSVRRIKQGKPVRLPAGRAMMGLRGKQAARRADGRAGRGCPRKRMPSCNRRDRGSCPTRKGS